MSSAFYQGSNSPVNKQNILPFHFRPLPPTQRSDFHLDMGSPNIKADIHEAPQPSVLPETPLDLHRWWQLKNLRTLNMLLLIPLLSIFAQG